MRLRVTILGCGTSTGVPRIGGDWGACDPSNPKNRRRRCAILVERQGREGVTRVLVDTPPEIREQLLDAGVGTVDGVLFTHDHADHTHGIDDLRVIAMNRRRRVDIYCEAQTYEVLRQRFAYCFATPKGGAYPPILNGHTIEPGEPFAIEGAGGAIEVLPFRQKHGSIASLGFRFAGIAYSTDINGLPEESLPLLQNLELWIVDALRYSSHPSHFSVDEALREIARVRPARAVLTHMHIDLDYETLRRALPEGIEPAYDGMVLEVGA